MSTHEIIPADAGQVVSTFSLRVTFNQHESGGVHYRIELDPGARESRNVSPQQLSERGAPVAHLGIRALHWLLMKKAVVQALDMASVLRRKTDQGQRFQPSGESDGEAQGRLFH